MKIQVLRMMHLPRYLIATALALSFIAPVQAQDATRTKDAPPEQVMLPPVRVTAEQGEPSTSAVSGTKSDIPLIETPQAISVVSAQDIEVRGVTRLSEALRTVAGVSRSTTYGFYDAYTIRGFDAAYGSVYLDGLINEAGVGINQELSALEQIEVLKGPASMLFGQAPLGGLINLVSKRPLEETFLKVNATAGSWDLIESTIDANSPLNSSGSLLGRLNVAYRDSDSFVRNSGINRIFAAPAMTWKLGTDTSVTFLGRYQRDRDNPISPVPAYGTVLRGVVAIPEEFSVNSGGSQRVINNRDRIQVGYVFDHRFSDAFDFSQTLRYTHRKESWDRWMFAAGFIDADGNAVFEPTDTIGRYYYGPYRTTDKDFAVDSRLGGSFRMGNVTHEWVSGVDYRRSRGSYFSAGDFDPTHFPLSILNPDYDAILDTVAVVGAPGDSHGDQKGVYIQDYLKLGDLVTLTLGGRYDWASAAEQRDHAFSPRIGATVQVVPGVNGYASWSRSFSPQLYSQQVIGFDDSGNPIGGPLPPERGKNIELGVKFAPEDATLSGSLAIFQLTRQNVATSDPVYSIFNVVTGEQRARGAEAEVQWQVTNSLNVDLAYSFVDAVVTKDNLFTVGAPLPNVPKHNIGAFAQYEVQRGALTGLGAVLGVMYNSRRNGDIYSRQPDGSVLIWLPAYTLVDAGLSYRRGAWGTQLTLANVFDKRYWPDTGGIDRVTPGNPRNWRLTLTREF